MKVSRFKIKYFLPSVISFFTFVLLITAIVYYTSFKYNLWEKDMRTEMLQILAIKKSNLEKLLHSNAHLTKSIATHIAINPNISSKQFNELVQEYTSENKLIQTVILTKGFTFDNIINPTASFEISNATELLTNTEEKASLKKAIETNQFFRTGPVEISKGKTALLCYEPIVSKNYKIQQKPLGVITITKDPISIFNLTNLNNNEAGLKFAIRNMNTENSNNAIFWGDKSIFENNPSSIQIQHPYGIWELASIPISGWGSILQGNLLLFNILIFGSCLICLLVGLFTRSLLKIKDNENQLTAIFESMDSLIMEFNSKGDYIQINSQKNNLLFRPKNELIGKNIDEIFNKEQAKLFKSAIKDCLESKKLVVIKYPLIIKEEEHWFSARLSYNNDNSIIYNVIDITKNKKQQDLLVQSEKELRELNKTKDKFFSIIAHDLKGPLGTHKSILKLVLDEYEELDESTRKNIIYSLRDSSESLYSLLENLLRWSKSQSGGLKVVMNEIAIHQHCNMLIPQFAKSAQLKNIRLINELNEKSRVLTDQNLTNTILRNLLSNAIKFTKTNGTVRIYSEELEKDGNQFINITVSDNGVGIQPQKLKTLFKIDKAISTPGTAKEKGNGLGLLLCQEFAEKLGTTITVCSSPEKGSSFSFMLPVA